MLPLLALIATGLYVLWFLLRRRQLCVRVADTKRPVTRVIPTPHVLSDEEDNDGTML